MRWLFAVVLVLHGLLHFLGLAKAFGWAELPQLRMPISRGEGMAWAFAGVAFVVTALLYLLGTRGWWILAVATVLLSQAVILRSWEDARVGTLPNALVLLVVVATLWGATGARGE